VFGASGAAAINCAAGSSGSFSANTALTFSAVNGFGDGGAKASTYKYLWNSNDADPTDWSTALTWNAGDPVISQALAGTYYLHLSALNGDGAQSSSSLTPGSYTFAQAPVPEPSSAVAVVGGLGSLLAIFRRRRRG